MFSVLEDLRVLCRKLQLCVDCTLLLPLTRRRTKKTDDDDDDIIIIIKIMMIFFQKYITIRTRLTLIGLNEMIFSFTTTEKLVDFFLKISHF